MSVALYRKYRPKKFAEVSDQNHIKITLQNEIETDRLGHAYLFCGPRGTGKTTLARLLSKAVNCLDLQAKGEPCNECDNCQDIVANKSMDIIEIDAASHTGVDNVRENIINNARFTPAKSKYKVFIIDEVHMLSTSAFNALLKILEEPPKHVIFILATTEVHKVPVTIISRCQRFDFKKISINSIVERLTWMVKGEGVSVDNEVLKIIAKHSGGCVRDAESLLEQVLSLGEKNITLDQAVLVLPQANHESLFELLEKVLKKEVKSVIELINQLVEDGVDLKQYSDNFVEFVRQVMVYKITNNLHELSRDLSDELVKKVIDLIKNHTAEQLVLIMQEIIVKQKQFQHNPIVQLGLEVALISYMGEVVPIMAEPKKAEPLPVEPLPIETIKAESRLVEPQASIDNQAKKVLNGLVSKDPATSSGAEISEVREADNVVKSGNGLSLTYNQIVTRWSAVLQAVKLKNYSLGMSLSVAKPIALVDNILTLGFLFDLQKQRVDNRENLDLIEQMVLSEFGAKLKIKTEVDPGLKLSDITTDQEGHDTEVKVEQTETDNLVSKVLDAFGGTVVDGLG